MSDNKLFAMVFDKKQIAENKLLKGNTYVKISNDQFSEIKDSISKISFERSNPNPDIVIVSFEFDNKAENNTFAVPVLFTKQSHRNGDLINLNSISKGCKLYKIHYEEDNNSKDYSLVIYEFFRAE